VLKALEHLGAAVRVTDNPQVIASAERLVLPGVGHFDATRALDPLRQSITERIAAGVPFLGICVGMQWLYVGSTEAPQVAGLGVLKGMVERFPAGSKVPHVGWNSIKRRCDDSRLLQGIEDESFVYYTHSYRCPLVEETAATTEYGGEFTAAIERGNLFGVQFHAEKSSDAGLQMLRNFLEYRP
jgi:glutamine amidotransferase